MNNEEIETFYEFAEAKNFLNTLKAEDSFHYLDDDIVTYAVALHHILMNDLDDESDSEVN